MKVVISGGTGFIGSALVDALAEKGYKVAILTRRPESVKNLRMGAVQVERWDGRTVRQWKEVLEGAAAVVCLTGVSIGGGRWSGERKALLLHSRVDPLNTLVEAIRQCHKKPAALISISGVDYYGDVPFPDVVEASPRGSDFLARLCGEWEQAAMKAAEEGVRVAILRSGVVLERGGGALPLMMFPFRLYAGGWLGAGSQWFSWVHRADLVEAFCRVIADTSMTGPFNVVGPEPVTMKEFCLTLGQVLGKPCWAPVPEFLVRGVLGEMSEMLLTGQRVLPSKLNEAGFTFKYQSAEDALRAILGSKSTLQ